MSLMGERSDHGLPISELVYRPHLPAELERLETTRAWSRALVVYDDQSALVVAAIAALNNMDLIISVDTHDKVTGVIDAKHLFHRARTPGRIVSSGLSYDFGPPFDVDDPLRSENLSGQIRARRPKLHWCKEGKHETTEDPCSQHEL